MQKVKMIFLRGAVPPQSEHPEKLLYENMQNCEDMWTQLFYYMLKESGASGELLYHHGSPRTFVIDERFTEKWVDMGSYAPDFRPDVIICRGGFPYYDRFLARFPDAKKVYYGAGPRIYPQTSFKDYDLFLVDSEIQKRTLEDRYGVVRAELFIKPAATLFKPVEVEKEYDVCFMANSFTAARKRFDWLMSSFAGSGLSMLVIGDVKKEHKDLARRLGVKVEFHPYCFRRELPWKICGCRVGICQSTSDDSCPRVIPEFLACGLPVVVTDKVNFWKEKYITEKTGIVVPDSYFILGIKTMLGLDICDPRTYYEEHLKVERAAGHLARLIGELWA